MRRICSIRSHIFHYTTGDITPGRKAGPPLFASYHGTSCAINTCTFGTWSSALTRFKFSSARALSTCISHRSSPVAASTTHANVFSPVTIRQLCAESPPRSIQEPFADVRARTLMWPATCPVFNLGIHPYFFRRGDHPPGASTMYRLPSPKKSSACGYGPIDVFISDLDMNRARSTGMAVDEKIPSGFSGYPLSSSSRHPSPTINVAFVNGVWSPMLHTQRIKNQKLCGFGDCASRTGPNVGD